VSRLRLYDNGTEIVVARSPSDAVRVFNTMLDGSCWCADCAKSWKEVVGPFTIGDETKDAKEWASGWRGPIASREYDWE